MLNTLLLATTLIAQSGAPAPPAAAPQNQPAQVAQAPATVDAKHKGDIAHDVEEGKKYAELVAKDYKPSQNKEYVARVERIGQEMAAIARVTQVNALWGDSRLSPFDYHFQVLKSDDVNAFSVPGGYVYVLEGLVKDVESDDELAAVLAHEIAHCALRHISTLEHEQSKLQRATLPLILVGILTHGMEGGATALTATNIYQTAMGSGWSLKAELAADAGGFQYMLRSKYNTTAMLTVMERFAQQERNSPQVDMGIYASHPPSKERAHALISQMKDEKVPIRRSEVATSYRAIAKPGDKGEVEIWFGNRKLFVLAGDDIAKRMDDAIPALNDFFDDTPELFELNLDGTRLMYKNRELLQITKADADAMGLSLDDAAKNALKSIRSALYVIAFRIWDE